MFRTSVVHLQERSYAVCCNLVCLNTSCCYEGEWRTALQFFLHPHNNRMYQIATYSIRTLLKMDYWSPKHVELLNVMNKINHLVLCILSDYIYILQGDTRSVQYQIPPCISSVALIWITEGSRVVNWLLIVGYGSPKRQIKTVCYLSCFQGEVSSVTPKHQKV